MFRTNEIVFHELNNEEIMDGINLIIPKHLKCLKNGAELTINQNGIWCSLDDKEPDKYKGEK